MAGKAGKDPIIETDASNQRGVVRSVRGPRVVVGFQRAEACERCGACPGKPGEGMFVEIPNTLGAKAGQQVELAFGKNPRYALMRLLHIGRGKPPRYRLHMVRILER